jgi:hypothetical protein
MTMLRNTQVLWRTMLRPIRKGWIMSWMSRLMKKFTSKAMSHEFVCVYEEILSLGITRSDVLDQTWWAVQLDITESGGLFISYIFSSFPWI